MNTNTTMDRQDRHAAAATGRTLARNGDDCVMVSVVR